MENDLLDDPRRGSREEAEKKSRIRWKNEYKGVRRGEGWRAKGGGNNKRRDRKLDIPNISAGRGGKVNNTRLPGAGAAILWITRTVRHIESVFRRVRIFA